MILLILSTCLAVTYADVSHVVNAKNDQNAKILSQELDVGVQGAYNWAFDTENGISAKASGGLSNTNSDAASQYAQGAAQWTAPNGETVAFQYVADENGYQPVGAFIPTPPPIPEAILRSLQYIRDHPPPPEK